MGLVDNVRWLCSENKITLIMLEKNLGFAKGSIYKWDKHAPSIERIKKVADYFGVSIEDLIRTK